MSIAIFARCHHYQCRQIDYPADRRGGRQHVYGPRSTKQDRADRDSTTARHLDWSFDTRCRRAMPEACDCGEKMRG